MCRSEHLCEARIAALLRCNGCAPILTSPAAKVDLLNAVGLKSARCVDPVGKQTIDVLMKLDFINHGTSTSQHRAVA